MDDLWTVQQPKQKPREQVPVGFYTAFFRGVEDYALNDGSVKWRFIFEIESGPESGKVVSTLTDRCLVPTTLPGVLVAGLLGRALKPGENVKDALDACRGKIYLVSVQSGPRGGKPCVRSCGSPPK